MVARRPTEKNTKTEILTAFDELLKQKDELLKQNKALETQLREKPAQSSPVAVSNKVDNDQPSSPPEPMPGSMTIPAMASQQKMEAIISGLNRLQLGFGSAVSDLSEKLTQEAFKLQEVRQSVTEEVEQLEALHDLQADDCNVETLIQQYEDSSKTFNEELRQQQETLNQELTQARKAWAKEQEEQQRLVKERNENARKTQGREGEEYRYSLELERKLADDEYDQEQTRLYAELEELRQTREKQWAEQEKTISERETQFAELKAKFEAIPKDLEAAIKRAKEEGRGIASHQAKIKSDLLAKDIEGQKRTYDLRIESFSATIQTQETRIQTLSNQLDSALKQVQDLAVKAIEGSANVSSFNAVKEIALEQAKNQNKVK
jgi:hypothetical protein